MTAATPFQNQAQIQDIREFAIVLAVSDLDPSRITEEFIRAQKIIDSRFQLRGASTRNPQRSQLVFDNGITIIARTNGIALIEKISDRPEDPQVSTVAAKWVASLPNLDYQGLKLEAKRLIPIPNQDAARSFLTEFLVASGAWQSYGQAPVKTGINFQYELGRCKLNLAIAEAIIKQENQADPWQQDVAGLLFSGTFIYPAFKDNKLTQAQQAIANSQSDWQEFNQIIEQVFLNPDNAILQQVMFG
ncbi:MAG: hypothetical protein AAFQ80_11110 [Cyanobacteria bacterium J06621_8]